VSPAAQSRAGLATLFAALVADPAGALVACDYDGTLAGIVADPGLAVPQPGAVEVLARLADLVGQVAVVTGRAADEAVRLGGLVAVPRLVVLGLYGRQRWSGGVLTDPGPPLGLDAAEQDARRLVEGAAPGVRLELKGGSFAVHTRQASDPAAALAALQDPLLAVAAAYGLAAEPGRFVLELRAPGSDKGRAVAELAAELPARSVLFAGDDVGDLPAFEAVRALAASGVPAWAVAASSAEAPEVAAAADLVVEGPAGVVRLLAGLADLLQ
jgi:trehalose 6-phosphate phosphatase